MSIFIAPPGRASTSTMGLVNPCGPHHFSKCFGSVKAAKTSARGASITRRKTSSSRFESVVIGLLLSLNVAKIIVEPVDLRIPEPAVLFHPRCGVTKRRCIEAARPPLRLPAPRDQAAALEHLEMLRNRGERHRKGPRKFTYGRFPRHQPRQNSPPRRIGKGSKGRAERV